MKRKKETTEASMRYAEKRRQNSREYFRKVREATLDLLGGKCLRCDFSDRRALQIDHVNGGGTKDKETIRGVYYKSVINSFLEGEGKYQLLCANCNWIKRVEQNETALGKRNHH